MTEPKTNAELEKCLKGVKEAIDTAARIHQIAMLGVSFAGAGRQPTVSIVVASTDVDRTTRLVVPPAVAAAKTCGLQPQFCVQTPADIND